MKCPKCAGLDSTVLETRSEDGYIIRRRRRCDGCGHKFTTHEIPPGAYTYARAHLARWRKAQEGAWKRYVRERQALGRRMREDRERGMKQVEIQAKYAKHGVSLWMVRHYTRIPRSQP